MSFSDPMADGPAIQASSLRALKAGQKMRDTLAMVRDFRKTDQDTPIVLMGYYNPIYVYPNDAFLNEAAEAGVDGLIVDEAHMFKNLYFYTAKNDIVGLKGSDADQALDMYLKVRHINQVSNNRNLIFATGTPIANVMSELYTMFRYLAQPELDRLGMAGADSWLNAYAEAEGTMEPRPEGGYKETLAPRRKDRGAKAVGSSQEGLQLQGKEGYLTWMYQVNSPFCSSRFKIGFPVRSLQEGMSLLEPESVQTIFKTCPEVMVPTAFLVLRTGKGQPMPRQSSSWSTLMSPIVSPEVGVGSFR